MFNSEKKISEKEGKKKKRIAKVNERKEREIDAQRKLDTEVMHQTEESERRALGKAMMKQAGGKNSFNRPCLDLLNNFQGKNYTLT